MDQLKSKFNEFSSIWILWMYLYHFFSLGSQVNLARATLFLIALNFSTCSFHGRLHQEKEGRKLKVIGPAPRTSFFLLYHLDWWWLGELVPTIRSFNDVTTSFLQVFLCVHSAVFRTNEKNVVFHIKYPLPWKKKTS